MVAPFVALAATLLPAPLRLTVLDEASVRELTLSSGGVRVGPPLADFQGVLTGVPASLGGERGGSRP